jgi:hypothetical protein
VRRVTSAQASLSSGSTCEDPPARLTADEIAREAVPLTASKLFR